MNTVCSENKCAGCKACIDICPTNSIKVIDSLRYTNAIIDTKTCIDCGLCHKTCQVNNPASLRQPVKWLEGWAKTDIRSTSSSGGIGQELIRSFINYGGEVVACKFVDGDFKFDIIKDLNELAPFVGSKYVKSNPDGIYRVIHGRLKLGKRILFIGLPCQVSAVRNYIPAKFQENLYVVDLICHGSPSVHLLRKSLKEYGYSMNNVQTIQFRKNIQFGLEVNHQKILPQGITDRYTLAFLRGLIYTENCYSCHYARTDRVGDLTIGDSWGTANKTELKKGMSLILCQTTKGKELMERMDFYFEKADIQNAVANNQQLNHPSVVPEQRAIFFKNIKEGMSFNKAVEKAYPKDCMKQDIKLKLDRMGIIKRNAN